MAKFKTDFKDEIVDKRTRQIIDATGAIIHNNVLIKNTYTPKQAGDKVGAAWFNDAGKALNDLGDGLENCRSITFYINATQISQTNDIRVRFNSIYANSDKQDVDSSLAQLVSSSDGRVQIKKAGRYLLLYEANYTLQAKKGVGVITVCRANDKLLAQTISGARWGAMVGGLFAVTGELLAGDIISVGANTDNDISNVGRAVLSVVYLGGAN